MLLPLSKSSIAADAILASLASIAVTLRVMARYQRKLPLRADDYTIIFALASLSFNSIYLYHLSVSSDCSTWDMSFGDSCWSHQYLSHPVAHDDGHRVLKIPEGNRRSVSSNYERLIEQQVLWIDVLLCHLVFAAIKLSIVLFYKRIFVPRWFQITANVLMGIVVSWLLAATFVCMTYIGPVGQRWVFKGQIFSRRPGDAWWTFDAGTNPAVAMNDSITSVFDYQIFLVSLVALDIGLDVFTLLLPVPVIRGLHISRAKKRSLFGVFGLGFL